MKFDFLCPTFIRFGNGVLETTGQEACKIGRKVLLVTGKSSSKKSGGLKRVEELLEKEGLQVVLYDQVEQNPSVETVEAGAGVARQAGCDLIVALGGGSPLDAAKGIAVLAAQGGGLDDYFGTDRASQALPVIAIPTTAGTASEVTRYAVITDWKSRQKRTVASFLICPRIAIVDPLLTVTMPKQITANTGMDALSHAVEGYLSLKSQPITDLLAIESIRLVANYLPRAVGQPEDLEAREKVMYASLLAGLVINQTRTGIIHGLGYELTLNYQIPHGLANALLMPQVMEFNRISCPEKMVQIARALGENVAGLSAREAGRKAAFAVKELSIDLGMPENAAEAGLRIEDIKGFAQNFVQTKRSFGAAPRYPDIKEVEEIYLKSFRGEI